MNFFKKESSSITPTVLTKESALAFLKTQDCTMEDISDLAIQTVGPLFADERISREEEFVIFEQMNKIEGLDDYLRNTMSKDVKRYFQASSEKEREQVRGAYARALYFRGLLHKKTLEAPVAKQPHILANDRYAFGPG